MSYFAPYIDAAGFHMPAYQDIVDQLVADAQNIYGQDIYLGYDSQDYQMISVFASMIYDSFLAAQAAYNSRSPSTAVGAALDAIVGVNGLVRKSAVYSTCQVVVSGTPGTMIANGVVSDVNGYNWSLPNPTVIGSGGRSTVTATCQTAGAIAANPGDINTIVTPQLGWSSVTNTVAATPGSPAETDSQLRARQAVSTEQPSQNMVDSLVAGLAAVPNIGRFKVYENYTNQTDANGIPSHSVDCVVEGGDPQDVANVIWLRKGIGCGTYGGTSVEITDSQGVVNTIYYDVPQYVDIDVTINVKQLQGFTQDTQAAIANAVYAYLNNAQIGVDVYNSALWGAALSANPTPNNPTFSVTGVTAAVHGQTQGTSDIPIAFNQVARGNLSYITVNVS
ncbi:hypothetical protein Alches_16300 [Alicyclobacillus hesperidum subsp. aegles]|uniref:baseplate J/gp47 family protein n=1 Tax=Alicyclobacillus hesperidum TaxID=89784 RepID=UPI00222911ED|nr:baseplate J/gp47 family protein [Alicyclobacillus hesperidum]GLG01590.1 hypothetical protein Alches_16300 [Alicyclobacillus hesperidum subsp. aegles]